MNYVIPAKTFLLGEYVALQGGPALLLTTRPAFAIRSSRQQGFSGVHPESPAGRYWQRFQHSSGLIWRDPYHALGGLGASTAQYLGAYWTTAQELQQPVSAAKLLADYRADNRSGQGVLPSGYDLLAQTLSGCVFLHQQQAACTVCAWPFVDLSFILVHTGKKLATHTHLMQVVLPFVMDDLAALVVMAHQAMQSKDSALFIYAVNAYREALRACNLVSEHSMQQMQTLSHNADVLAIKGCGALGADVLLIIVPVARLSAVRIQLVAQGYRVLASEGDLYAGAGLFLPEDIFLTDCY